jgi:hypothetical protein
MRKSVVIWWMFVLMLAVAGGIRAQDVNDERRPIAEFSELEFDFGEVFESAEYRHIFTIRNKGKSDLIIEDVKPG